MAPLLVDPCDHLKPHHSVGHCLKFVGLDAECRHGVSRLVNSGT